MKEWVNNGFETANTVTFPIAVHISYFSINFSAGLFFN